MAVLQKKKETLQKTSRTIGSVLCLLFVALMAAGCGKVEEPIPVQLSSGNVEELQNGVAGEIEDDPDEAAAENIDSDSEDISSENIQQTEDAQAQSVGSAELEGNVRSIGVDSFVIARHEVWSEGDADYAVGAAPGYEKEEDRITVYVNQNCVWEFETVKNSGVNPEDISSREGSFADLQDGIAISIKGSWQDDGSFLADSIVMMKFV